MDPSNSSCSATMGSKIFLSIGPLLLGFGTCTNIFSLLVLSRKRMRKHSTYVYLAILSVIDLLALWLGLLRDYLAHGYGIYITSTWLCKLHSFLFYYTLDLSSWILVAVSIDRFLAITFVFSSYTRQLLLKLLAKPKMICFIICCCLMALNLHFLFYVEAIADRSKVIKSKSMPNVNKNLNEKSIVTNRTNNFIFYHETNKPICSNLEIASESKPLMVMPYELSYQHRLTSYDEMQSIGVAGEYFFCVIDESKNPKYMYFFLNIWPYIDLSAYVILPFCIMSICNIAIIKNAKFSTTSTMTPMSQLTRNNQQNSKKNIKCFFSKKYNWKKTFISSSKNNFSINNSSKSLNEISIVLNNMRLNRIEEKPKLTNSIRKIICNCFKEPSNRPRLQSYTLSTSMDHRCSSCQLKSLNEEKLIEEDNKRLLLKPNSIAATCSGSSNNNNQSDNNNNTNNNGKTKDPRNSFPTFSFKNYSSLSLNQNQKSSTLVYTSPLSTSIISANLHSRNIKMMTLTIIFITCMFILLTLPIMLFIVIKKLSTGLFIELKSDKIIDSKSSSSSSSPSSSASFGSDNYSSFTNSSKTSFLFGSIASSFFNMDPNCKSILWAVVNIFMYVNHSINFVLYCLTGSKFRTELATLFVSPQVFINNATILHENSKFTTTFKTFSNKGFTNIKYPSECRSYRSQSIFVGPS